MDKGPSLPVRIVPLGVGIVLVLTSIFVRSDPLAVALVVFGTAAIFSPILWVGPAYVRSPKPTDERYEQLNYRAGWYAYFLLLWVVGLYVMLTDLVDVGPRLLIYGFVTVHAVYGIIKWWLARNPEPWK